MLVNLLRRIFRAIFRPDHFIELNDDQVFKLAHMADDMDEPVHVVGSQLLDFALEQHYMRSEIIDKWEKLSPRQQEVTALICLGYKTLQIAAKLNISSETVKSHRKNIFRLLGVVSKKQLLEEFKGWNFREWVRWHDAPSSEINK